MTVYTLIQALILDAISRIKTTLPAGPDFNQSEGNRSTLSEEALVEILVISRKPVH